MQHKLNEGKLLNQSGNLEEAGYAFDLVRKYERKAIKTGPMSIKEWDYYYIGCKDYGVAVTIADNSYMWLCTATILNFKENWEVTKSQMGAFSFGSLHLPETSHTGDIIKEGKGFSFKFYNDNGKRHLIVHYENFDDNEDYDLDVYLTQPIKDTMVIATPWDKPKYFYYNQKINCLDAKGTLKFKNVTYNLDNCHGVLDWGRGVWTYKNTWYWSSLSAVDSFGNSIGFNLGYGFGNTSEASENMLFYKDKAYKLEDVDFGLPVKDGKDDFMSKWHFTSKDKSIDMIFTPTLDRYTNTNALIIHTLQHQVFGTFNGVIKVDGKEFKIENLPGFAEKVYMKY